MPGLGRRPKTINLVKAGNDKTRHTKATLKAREAAEPHIKTKKLICPKRLSEEARVEWERIASLYLEFEDTIISDLDVDALMVYCEALVTYNNASEKIKNTAAVYLHPKDGTPAINPWVKICNDATEIMRKHSDMLLLNPISRARAGLARVKADKDNISPMARFIKERVNGDRQ